MVQPGAVLLLGFRASRSKWTGTGTQSFLGPLLPHTTHPTHLSTLSIQLTSTGCLQGSGAGLRPGTHHWPRTRCGAVMGPAAGSRMLSNVSSILLRCAVHLSARVG